MANKYDLKTWTASALASGGAGSACGTNIGGAAVVAGKTRFLTHIRVTRRSTAQGSSQLTAVRLQIGSVTTGAASTPSVASGRKVNVAMPARSAVTNMNLSDVDVIQTIQGTIDNPILSVAGGAWMGLALGGADADVSAQYYDE